MTELKGFGLYYFYDCNHPIALKNQKELKDPVYNSFMYKTCHESNANRIPSLTVYQTQNYRRNPFTGLTMKKINHNYQIRELNKEKLKDFLDKSMTDYTRKIFSMEDYQAFVKDPSERNMNKVFLFTDKITVTNVMKALSAEFRDRIRFFVVFAPEDSKNAAFENEILKMYNITDRDNLPELIVEQT